MYLIGEEALLAHDVQDTFPLGDNKVYIYLSVCTCVKVRQFHTRQRTQSADNKYFWLTLDRNSKNLPVYKFRQKNKLLKEQLKNFHIIITAVV